MANSTSSGSRTIKKDTLSPPPPPPPSRTIPRRLVPFRHPDFTDDQIRRLTQRPGTDARSLNASSSPKLLSVQGRGGSPAVSPGGVSPGTDVGDGELLSAVMARLFWLEAKLSEAHRQLQIKERNIGRLEEAIFVAKRGRITPRSSPCRDLDETWLRSPDRGNQAEVKLSVDTDEVDTEERFRVLGASSSPSRSCSPSEDSVCMDYDRVIDNIKDLNTLAGEGVPQIYPSSESSKFKLVNSVPLALYSNGLTLCGGPFRPFEDRDAKRCVSDLMDGYFPSELQRRYPNGVPLEVFDKRHTKFEECTGVPTVTVVDFARGRSPSPMSPPSSRAPEVATENVLSRVTVRRLPNSLPECVVEMRNSVGQLSKDFIRTPTLQCIGKGYATKSMTTLRIKSETGNETFLMMLFATDTIGDVRKYLDAHRRLPHSTKYDIVTPYPRRALTDPNETLESCGLVPNAALYLRQIA